MSFSRKKKLVFYFSMFGILFFLMLISAEVLVRIFLPSYSMEALRKSSLQYSPSTVGRYTLKPNQTVTIDSNRIWKINEYGYRGESVSFAKPERVTRIAVIGGSAVFDQNVTHNQDWPHLIQNDLLARGFSNIEVLNAGVPGHASFDSIGRLYSQIWMFEPDYVLLYNAWNDIKYFRVVNSQKPLLIWKSEYYKIDPRINHVGFLDKCLSVSELYMQLRMRYLWRKLKFDSEGIVPEGYYADEYSVWATKQYRLNIQLFVDICRNIGANPILMTQATLVSPSSSQEEKKIIGYHYQTLNHTALVDAYQKCDQIVRNVAEEKGVRLIDLDSMLTGKSEFFQDHVHLSADGGRTIAKIVAEYLAHQLKRTKTNPLSIQALQSSAN